MGVWAVLGMTISYRVGEPQVLRLRRNRGGCAQDDNFIGVGGCARDDNFIPGGGTGRDDNFIGVWAVLGMTIS